MNRFVVGAWLAAAGVVAGHDLRLLGPKLSLRPGETVVLKPVWSHGDDDGAPVADADLARSAVKDGHDTAAPPPARKPGEGLRIAPRREGIVQAFVEGRPTVRTKVIETDGRHGHRDLDKRQVKDAAAVSATRGRRLAKAIVVCGEPAAAPAACGLAFEIVPLDAPAAWRPAAALRFRVLLDGKPAAGQWLEAGAEGASQGDGAEFSLSARTDAAGIAALSFPEPGVWTLRAERIVPAAAADRPRFDDERLTATLSMEIPRRAAP